MVTHRGRSLWILTVWWWRQSLSAAGRWSDLPSRWLTPPHSWESKPSGSTRLPLQWGTGNRKSSTATAAYGFPQSRQCEIMLTKCSNNCLVTPLPSCFICLFIHCCENAGANALHSFIHSFVLSYRDRLERVWGEKWMHAGAASPHQNWTILLP